MKTKRTRSHGNRSRSRIAHKRNPLGGKVLLVLGLMVALGLSACNTEIPTAPFSSSSKDGSAPAAAKSDEKDWHDPKPPAALKVSLLLNEQPEHSQFTRHIRLTNYAGDYVDLDFDFVRTGARRWEAVIDTSSTEFAALEAIGQNGKRSYWDRIALANRGGSTELDVQRLTLTWVYADCSDYLETQKTGDDTLSFSFAVNRVLEAGQDTLCLDSGLRRARMRHAGLNDGFVAANPGESALVLAVNDLAKTGSDGEGQDEYGANPKYDLALEPLCSEFVSWYYAEAGLPLEGIDDVQNTHALYDLFADDDRMYDFNENTQRFEDDGGTRYDPRPGDYLAWMTIDAASGDTLGYHSMLLLDYDSGTNRARVINGPWPVRIRTVEVDAWAAKADNGGNPFFFGIGRAD